MPTTDLLVEALAELSKLITGKLLTEAQLEAASKNIVGRYFSDFLATPQKEVEAKERIEKARHHITEASAIIGSIQNELEDQAAKLESLVKDIEEKKQLADRYATLAKTNQEYITALRAEMEDSVRQGLLAQSEKHKFRRQLIALLVFVLGAVFSSLVQFAMEPSAKPFIERIIKKDPSPSPTPGSTPTRPPER
jgi:Rad3-related DNA helicase